MPKRAYYYHHDFFTMSNDEELTILQNFKTFQQTENYTCGPVCVQMILEYYKDKVPTEEELKKELKSKKKKGTEIVNIVNFFKKKKYEIDCSLTRKRNKEGYIFPDFFSFQNFVIENLRLGYPILVESFYYGGHYEIIIGYDKRSKENDFKKDILILADSADDTDDYVDGYHYLSAYKFFSMWRDVLYLKKKNQIQPFIVVKKKSGF